MSEGPTDERPGLRRAIAALEHRDFRLLWVASLVAAIGGQIQGTANLWQIFLLTGSPLHLGLTGLARAVPIIAFSLAGGVIADRFERRKIIMSAQALNGLLAIGLGLLSATGQIEVWHIYLVTFLGATLMALSAPARTAIIASLVPRHHLMNAMALNNITWQATRIGAPALAGTMIVAIGLPYTYGVNGLAHLITFAALGLIYLGPIPTRPRGSPLQNLAEGLAFVRRRSIILALLATDAAATFFGSVQALLPIFADRLEAGATGFGLLSSAEGVGAVLGATVVMSLGDVRYKGFLIVGSILAYCACLVGLALSPWFLVALFFAGGIGLTDSMQATPRNAVIQLITPDALRGRVSAFQHMLTVGMPHLGQGFMGGAAFLLTAPVALISGAAICALVNVGILAGRSDLRARDLGSVPASDAVPVQGRL